MIDDALRGLREIVLEFLVASLAERVEALERADDHVYSERDELRRRAEWYEARGRCLMACPHGDRCVLWRGHELEKFEDTEVAIGCSHRGCFCNEPNAPIAEDPVDRLRAALAEAVAIARESSPAPLPTSAAACCAPAPLSFAVACGPAIDPRIAACAAPVGGEWHSVVLDAAASYRRAARLDELEKLARDPTTAPADE